MRSVSFVGRLYCMMFSVPEREAQNVCGALSVPANHLRPSWYPTADG